MNEQRISVDVRQIEVVLSNGERLMGETFLQLHGMLQSGPQRLSEALNGDDNFLPLRVAEKIKLINLDQVMAVYTAAAEEYDPLLELGEEHRVRVTPAVGGPLDAKIFVNLPNGNNRAKDFLNQPRRFLLFLWGEQVAYLARKRILLVED
ncbi:hypothetical protein [Geopsychrobacter electrodiphilus]|uniref:hypothetical protein n=1 Tax=Geopsychrobacter electrodiphilus TaxID=225196 RepID=UPI0003664B62|nr:hypothetical protein [Geopsychrobacter electrodiphilus]